MDGIRLDKAMDWLLLAAVIVTATNLKRDSCTKIGQAKKSHRVSLD